MWRPLIRPWQAAQFHQALTLQWLQHLQMLDTGAGAHSHEAEC